MTVSLHSPPPDEGAPAAVSFKTVRMGRMLGDLHTIMCVCDQTHGTLRFIAFSRPCKLLFVPILMGVTIALENILSSYIMYVAHKLCMQRNVCHVHTTRKSACPDTACSCANLAAIYQVNIMVLCLVNIFSPAFLSHKAVIQRST